jgi:hypothetical protein
VKVAALAVISVQLAQLSGGSIHATSPDPLTVMVFPSFPVAGGNAESMNAIRPSMLFSGTWSGAGPIKLTAIPSHLL